jgi:hypothetical protein
MQQAPTGLCCAEHDCSVLHLACFDCVLQLPQHHGAPESRNC